MNGLAQGSEEASSTFDAVVIGGGIAGVSIAAELSEDRSVLLVETESTLAQHTTGRSAALLLRWLGNRVVRNLTRVSTDLLVDPPEDFDGPLVARKSAVWVAGPTGAARLAVLAGSVAADVSGVAQIDGQEAEALVPFMRPGWTSAALLDDSAQELDVSALHQGYVRRLRRFGGTVRVAAQVLGLERRAATWTVELSGGDRVEAPLVVNAAGAWADTVAVLAGTRPLGLRPLRRTAFTIARPDQYSAADLPSVRDVDESWYVKPEGPHFLCSPADETPSEPCDARPEEIDIAMAIDTINEATLLDIRSIRASWAGLRTFAPDRIPVVGMDPDVPGLLWVAGYGGFGIQAGPAIAQAAVSIVRTGQLPQTLRDTGVSLDELAPGRPSLSMSALAS